MLGRLLLITDNINPVVNEGFRDEFSHLAMFEVAGESVPVLMSTEQ